LPSRFDKNSARQKAGNAEAARQPLRLAVMACNP